MKISIYSICKNEIKFVDRFISGVCKADEIIICDTGSDDGTYEKLIDYSKIYPNIIIKKIYVTPWRFDTAKNTALSLVSADSDYCLSLDFDEIIDQEFILNLKNNINTDKDYYHVRFNTIWDWEFGDSSQIKEAWIERLHTRWNYRWTLPIHEKLTYTGPNKTENDGWLDFTFYQKPDINKVREYISKFELSLKEEPNNWKTYCFYAIELAAKRKNVKALDLLKEALKIEDADKAYIHSLISNILENPLDKINELKNALIYFPQREYYVYISRLYYGINDINNAILYYEFAKEATTIITGYKYDITCWNESFNNYGELIYSRKG